MSFVSQRQLRRAKIVGEATDVWGDVWDVRETRSTGYGFDVMLGWPESAARGPGGVGGPRVIVTPDLASWLNAMRGSTTPLVLPIGATAIKRVRRLLGYHRHIDRADWWELRADDLAQLTLAAFAKKHRVSMGAASIAHTAYYGPLLRSAGWWRSEDIAAMLLSDRPASMIAEDLMMSASGVRRLRQMLRAEAQTKKKPDPRVSRSRASREDAGYRPARVHSGGKSPSASGGSMPCWRNAFSILTMRADKRRTSSFNPPISSSSCFRSI